MEKRESFQQMRLEGTIEICIQNNEPRHSPYTAKQITDINVNQKDKTSRKKKENLGDLGFDNDSRYSSTAHLIKDFEKLANRTVREQRTNSCPQF